MEYEYSIFEKLFIMFLNSFASFSILPNIFLIKYQKKTFTYIIGCFSMITSIMYHFCESLELEIFLDNYKWHELVNITGIFCFIQILVTFTKYHHDLNSLSKKNYIFFFLIILIQQRGPWEIINTLIPIFLDFLVEIYLIIKYGLPILNYSILCYGLIFMIIALFCFYKGLNDSKDYLRLWHIFWHIFVNTSAYFFLQIQQNEFINVIRIMKYFLENDDENDDRKFINLSKGYEEYLENYNNDEENKSQILNEANNSKDAGKLTFE